MVLSKRREVLDMEEGGSRFRYAFPMVELTRKVLDQKYAGNNVLNTMADRWYQLLQWQVCLECQETFAGIDERELYGFMMPTFFDSEKLEMESEQTFWNRIFRSAFEAAHQWECDTCMDAKELFIDQSGTERSVKFWKPLGVMCTLLLWLGIVLKREYGYFKELVLPKAADRYRLCFRDCLPKLLQNALMYKWKTSRGYFVLGRAPELMVMAI